MKGIQEAELDLQKEKDKKQEEEVFWLCCLGVYAGTELEWATKVWVGRVQSQGVAVSVHSIPCHLLD